ncbi:MAG TPA: ABC transporter substrate-binding protein [Herbaspirillum sp.]|jgi:NitT/TauT family transport system substrate-binding protein
MTPRHFIVRLVCSLLLFAGASATCVADTDVIRVGITNTSSDVGFYIADKKGYFKEEGITVELIKFDSAAKMIAPLGAGQLEIGSGSASAGLYNAVARKIDIKIVADKGSTPPGYGYQPLLVRKDLVESGRYKELKDLKGLKIAVSAAGSASTSTLHEAVSQGGLKDGDVESVYMGFPQQVMALQNKAIDAAFTGEPSATKAVQMGSAIRIMGDDVIYPDHQVGVVLYSGIFAKERTESAKRFMRAYLRAVRDYNDALKDGKLNGPRAEEIIAILTEYTNIKDPAVYRAISPQGCNPDGIVHLPSLKKDLAFFKEKGEVKGTVSVDDALDGSFAKAVAKELGPYKQMPAK